MLCIEDCKSFIRLSKPEVSAEAFLPEVERAGLVRELGWLAWLLYVEIPDETESEGV
jgi:hypothetical protein